MLTWLFGSTAEPMRRRSDLPEPPRPFSEALHRGFLDALMRSPARMVICLFADILGTAERYNTPGSVGDPNWTPRLERAVGQLDADPGFAAGVVRYVGLARGQGRCGGGSPCQPVADG